MAETKAPQNETAVEEPLNEAAPLEVKQLTSDKIGNYVIENTSKVFTIIGAIIVVFLAYYAYDNFMVKPKNHEGFENMFASEAAYKRGDFQLALDGDEKNLGFTTIASDYSGTQAGNLSNFYAGISHLQLGNFDDAISYLEDYSATDLFTGTIALGGLGDAYAEKGNTDAAIQAYTKAAANKANEFLTPLYLMKAARAMDVAGNHSGALKMYLKIQNEYPTSYEGRDIEKYVARAEAKN